MGEKMYKWIVDVCVESGYSPEASKEIALLILALLAIGVISLIFRIKEWFDKEDIMPKNISDASEIMSQLLAKLK